MSPIPRVHHQVLGKFLLPRLLVILTLLLQIVYTGSKNKSTKGILSLFSLFLFTTAIYVVHTDHALDCVLVLVYWCTIVLHSTLVGLYRFAVADRITSTISPACPPKSGQASQRDLLPGSSTDGTAIPNASVPGKSSVAFPRLPNASVDIDSTGHINGLDVFAEISILPKRTRKIAQKRSEPVNVAKLRASFAAVVTPGSALSTLPKIIIHEKLSELPFASSGSPSFTTTANSSPRAFSTSKTAPTTRCSFHPDLQSDFEPEDVGDPEPPTNATATVPNIVISAGPQDRSFSAAHSPSPTTITALFAHSTSASQTGPLAPRSNSTLDTGSDAAWDAMDDPAGPTSVFLTPPPAAIVNGKFPDLSSNSSYSNASSTASLSAFLSSTSTLQTSATTPCSTLLDLPSDVERDINFADTPISTTRDITEKIKLPKSDVETLGELASQRSTAEEVRVRDHRRDSGDPTNLFEFDGDAMTENGYHWRWAKREGKLPEGGRRIWRSESNLQLASPTSMHAHRAVVDDGPLSSMTPAMPTSPTPPRAVLCGSKDNAVDEYDFSSAELAQAIGGSSKQGPSRPSDEIANATGDDARSSRLSVTTTSTLVDTDDDEEDDVDKQGFSKRDQRKAMVESSRAARARPFYGASTSSAGNQPLSQKDWDMLEQYVAASSCPRKVVRPQSPASTHIDTEMVVTLFPLPPPPPLPELM